jgi:hypothetical protein
MPSNVKSTTPVETGPKVKGVTIRSLMRSLEQLRGKKVYEAVVNAMPPGLADAVRYGTIIASKWYPLEWYRGIHAAIVSATGEGERIICEIERESARYDMTGIYKVAFKVLSPETLIGISARLFSTYYDTGKLEKVESRKGYVRMRWTGCKGFNRTIWAGMFASCEVMLELAGAKNVRFHTLSGGGEHDDSLPRPKRIGRKGNREDIVNV